MKGKTARPRKNKRRVILIFGENENDGYALKNLVEALRPGLAHVETRRTPIILARRAHMQKRAGMCEEIRKAAAAAQVANTVVAVVAHRDCDEIEPAHVQNSKELLADLNKHGLPTPIAATPAFELEAWWFLWPQALARTRPCWKAVGPRGQVGRITDAKKALQRALRPHSGAARCPDYAESDSRRIAEHVKGLGIVRDYEGASASFADFVAQIDGIVV